MFTQNTIERWLRSLKCDNSYFNDYQIPKELVPELQHMFSNTITNKDYEIHGRIEERKDGYVKLNCGGGETIWVKEFSQTVLKLIRSV